MYFTGHPANKGKAPHFLAGWGSMKIYAWFGQWTCYNVRKNVHIWENLQNVHKMFVACSAGFGYNIGKKSKRISLVGYETNQNRINRGYRA